MTSLTGSAGEDFASILRALGYRMERRPPPPPKPVVVEAPRRNRVPLMRAGRDFVTGSDSSPRNAAAESGVAAARDATARRRGERLQAAESRYHTAAPASQRGDSRAVRDIAPRSRRCEAVSDRRRRRTRFGRRPTSCPVEALPLPPAGRSETLRPAKRRRSQLPPKPPPRDRCRREATMRKAARGAEVARGRNGRGLAARRPFRRAPAAP